MPKRRDPMQALGKARSIGPTSAMRQLQSIMNPPTEPSIGPTPPEVMGEAPMGPGGGIASAISAIPPGIAKQAGKMMVGEIKDPTLKRIWEALQELYPRTVGHVDSVSTSPASTSLFAPWAKVVGSRTGRGFPTSDVVRDADNMRDAALKWSKMGTIEINPKASDVANTAAHELRHQSQALMDSQFDMKYSDLNRILGYADNPYEMQARGAGKKFSKELAAADALKSTPKRLRTARTEIKRFNRRPPPGSMAEFSPMGSHDRPLLDKEGRDQLHKLRRKK